jgi:uncharacterized protein (TIGR03435 family)
MPRADDHKPHFSPSHTVHISPAKTADGGDSGNNRFHNFLGVTLRHILAQVFDVSPVRILLPAPLDNSKLYDVAIVLPETGSTESNSNRILQEVEEYFGVVVSREELLLDVYVVNTANGKSPARPIQGDDGSSFRGGIVTLRHSTIEGGPDELPGMIKPVGLGAIQAIALEGTMDDFCRTLEYGLDRPVVNETELAGEYAFHLNAGSESANDFLERLRDQFNISITQAERRVHMVVLKPR